MPQTFGIAAVGGTPVKEKEFPHMVIMNYTFNQIKDRYY